MKRTVPVILLFGILMVLATCDFAQAATSDDPGSAQEIPSGTIPHLVKFNGTVRTPGGKLPKGLITVTFSVYPLQFGSSPLWSETQKVAVDAQGNFTVLLGAMTASGLPQDLFSSGEALWLGVQPQLPAAGEMPRVMLVAVPYALESADSDALGGKPASAYVTVDSLNLITATGLALLGSQAGHGGGVSGAGNPGTPGENSTAITPHPATACTKVASSGAAAANFMAKFTSACNVEKSLLYDTGTKVGLGTMAPLALFDVFPPAQTGISGAQYGVRLVLRFNPGANSSGDYGVYLNAQSVSGNSLNLSQINGLSYGSDHFGTGTVGYLVGSSGAVANRSSGNVGNAIGLQTSVANLGAGALTAAFGLKVGPPQNSGGGSIGTYYGVLITAPSAATKNYALFSGGGINYLGGMVGIGTPKPATQLDVNGAATFRQGVTFQRPVTFGPGQAYPGAGTITGVLPGTSLTGGGLTGTVTLDLNTTHIATLKGSNTFTQGQRIFHGTLSSSVDGGTALYVSSAAIGGTALSVGTATAFADGQSSIGILGAGYIGVSGESDAGIGVLGLGDASSTGGAWAGLFMGDLQGGAGDVSVTGNLSKAGGAFQIDDPVDPANKYLSHSFVESPDMKNVYDGVATLDAQGEALVTLPNWFGSLNQDFRYQLTAMGQPGPELYIAQEVSQNQFKIAGGKGGMKVSWMVTGIRHDAWANAHRIPVEENKPARDRGYYLHPELFGQPGEKNVMRLPQKSAKSSINRDKKSP